ncbi:MAG TPA: hypothetical protein VKB57_10930 [Acidimicrobiales bacterium]|nr:hypothetical protein [Acidimicrobiales bacterium]
MDDPVTYRLVPRAMSWIVGADALVLAVGLAACLALGQYLLALVVVLMGAVLAVVVLANVRGATRSIVLTDATLEFVAPARRTVVPWADVEAASELRRGRRRTVAWQLAGGRTVRTLSGFHPDRMLEDVSRRAPHVRIDG